MRRGLLVAISFAVAGAVVLAVSLQAAEPSGPGTVLGAVLLLGGLVRLLQTVTGS